MFQEEDGCYEDVSIKCSVISDIFENFMTNVYVHLKLSMVLSPSLICTVMELYKSLLYPISGCLVTKGNCIVLTHLVRVQ